MRAEEYAIANYRDFTVGPKAIPAREQRRWTRPVGSYS
jgi:hypothetical protein